MRIRHTEEVDDLRLDYHVHLEYDENQQPLSLDKNRLLRYVERAQAAGVSEIGISEHCYRFREFAPVFQSLIEGPSVLSSVRQFFAGCFVDTLGEYVEFLLSLQDEGLPLKVGVEVDYVPGEEDLTGRILAGYPWDFVMGSVHFLGTFPIDASPTVGWPQRNVEATYQEYFATWTKACCSGIFDTMAHPDLLKKFGHRPASPPRTLFTAAAAAAKAAGVAVEVSSAGLRKPVGEIYPSQELLAAFCEAGVPITLGSDAHSVDDVGLGLTEAVQWARQAGYHTLTRFSRRSSTQELFN